MLLTGCKREPQYESEPQVAVAPETTRAGTSGTLSVRVAEVHVAFQQGEPGALEDCQQVGRDALVLGDQEIIANVAFILVEQGYADQALAFLDEAQFQFPLDRGHKGLLFPRADALESQGRHVEAAQAFATALTIEPVSPFEYSGAVDLWIAADRFDDAAQVAAAGLIRFPGDPVLLQTAAEVSLRSGKASDALDQLDAILTTQPDEVGAHILRMECLLVLGEDEEARKAAQHFEQTYTMLSHGTIFLGLAEARLGHAEAAEAAWKVAEGEIAECTMCAGDESALLGWAREQAGAEEVVPQDR